MGKLISNQCVGGVPCCGADCPDNCDCCCPRLKAVIAGFTGECGTQVNGTLYFDKSGCSFNVDLLDPEIPPDIFSGIIQCVNGIWTISIAANLNILVAQKMADNSGCPPMGEWELVGQYADEENECQGQTGTITLSCATEGWQPVNQCKSVVPCSYCSCTPEKRTVIFSGITICECLINRIAISIGSINGTHCLTQNPLNSCRWDGVIPDAFVYRLYEGENCSGDYTEHTADILITLYFLGDGYEYLDVFIDYDVHLFTASWVQSDCVESIDVDSALTTCLTPNMTYGGSATILPCCD